jgi:hypothetical protein
VWLASYPKSGNTWTRAFLHNLVHVTSGHTQAQQINDLHQFSLGVANKKPFEEIIGFALTDEHRNEIAAARAKLQQYIADAVEGLVFVKTHEALVVDRGHLTINFAVTAGAIYIVRNPLDVAIFLRPSSGPADRLRHRFYELNERGNSSHEETGLRNLRLVEPTRLELDAKAASGDLRDALRGHAQRTAKDLRRVGAASVIQAERARARRGHQSLVVREAEEQEEKAGFRERPEKAERFFRDGRAGQWKEVLTSAQIARIIDAHQEQMELFGYLPI